MGLSLSSNAPGDTKLYKLFTRLANWSALTTLCDLIRQRDSIPIPTSGPRKSRLRPSYADAIMTYLAFCVDKTAATK